MDKIICSYASKGREDYNKGLLRLITSLKGNWDGYTYFHSKDGSTNELNGHTIHLGELESCEAFEHKDHSEHPYLFKFTIIQKLREKGYKKIIWLDSSLVLHKDPTQLLEPFGVMAFHNLGHPLWRYISDDAVKELKCGDNLLHIKQTWGGAIGFDFTKQKAREAFDMILEHKEAFKEGGSERDGFVAHRHDQAVMSVVFDKLGIPLRPYGQIVTHPHYLPPYEYGENFYIIHKPI